MLCTQFSKSHTIARWITNEKKKRSKIQKFLNGHLSTATFQFWLKQYPTFLLGRLELFPDVLNFIFFIAFNFILQDLIVLYLISFISLSIWHKVTVNFSVRITNIISPWLCIGAIPLPHFHPGAGVLGSNAVLLVTVRMQQ